MKTFFSALPVEVETTFDLYSVSFIRFCFPEVKWTDFGPRWVRAGRRSFFNGMGYNLSEVLNKDDPEDAKGVTREQRIDYLIATCGLMKENSDAFSSMDCDYLVPTLKERVYSNYFGKSDKKLYTVYNKNDQPVSNVVMQISPKNDYHCVELLYDREVGFDSGTGIISGSIEPWDVVCFAILPEIIDVQQQGNVLDVKLRKNLSAAKLKLYVDIDDGKNKGEIVQLKSGEARIDLGKYKGKRLIIKLFDGEYMTDERIVQL